MMCGESFHYIGVFGDVPERCYSVSAACNAPMDPSNQKIKTTRIEGHVYVGGDAVTYVSIAQHCRILTHF